MTRNEIKKILISIGIPDSIIDSLTDEKLASIINQIIDNDESIRNYIQLKSKRQEPHFEEHKPINKMFSYGTAGKSIHLHVPIDLRQIISEMGLSKTFDMVNLQLLDAIERIRNLQNQGNHEFEGKDYIYMISPLLVGREIRFLNEMDFITQVFTRKDLQDDQFVCEHPEAILATHIFGRNSNVGTAVIRLTDVNTDEWQAKRKAKIKEFEKKGIKLDTEGKI